MVKGLLVGLAVVLVLAVAFLFWPVSTSGFVSHSQPVQSYDEAVQRIEALKAAEVGFNPACEVQFLTHGDQTENVIVLVHGYTSCPDAYRALGQLFYERGYNVLIAPLPRHGLADRLNDDQSHLTAEELVAYGDQVADIAQGLGKQVTVMGHSLGGVVTAWLAQVRADVDLAVVIAPGFGYQAVPKQFTAPASRLYSIKPNSYGWWDPNSQADMKPAHSYPRYSTRALAQVLRLGLITRALAATDAPRAGSILVITNAHDDRVDNVQAAEVVQVWRQQGYSRLSTYEFPASLQLPHELIDPEQWDGHIEAVYPKLLELVAPEN